MINILQILLSGLSQSQYYSWSILTNILDAVIVGVAIGIASLVIKATVMHRQNKSLIESNTYRLVSALSDLADIFHEQLNPKNIKSYKKHYINIATTRQNKRHLYTSLPKNLSMIIYKHAIYLLMKPIYKSLSLDTFFLFSHKVNWTEFTSMSKNNFCSIYKKFPSTRKVYINSHPSFKICYNLYRKLKGGN